MGPPTRAQARFSTAPAIMKDADPQPYASMQGKLHPSILNSLKAMNFEYMTPVQSKVLSTLPTWRSDCLVQAKTGTGKTVAFLLPTLHHLLTFPPLPRGQVDTLVLSPTRELALQIAKECDQLTTAAPRRIECHTAFGGTARATNFNKFIGGSPSILVATPGRLKDYLTDNSAKARFANIRTVVLDEADVMLEQGFLQDVQHILRLLPPKSTGWQGMCFSATVPEKIKDVISTVLAPNYSRISTIDHSEPPTHARVPQYHVIIPSVRNTLPSLLSLVKYEHNHSPKDSKIIVFGTTANVVALYGEIFENKPGVPLDVFELHSRLSQTQRTRTTEAFKKASTGIMFATDVIGRGMDFPDVTCVIQVGLPASGEQYVHRVGRTARVDKDGRAVILLTQAESFFLAVNRQLPIKPYAHTSKIFEDGGCNETISRILTQVDERTKQKAYSAYLGFMKGVMNKMRLKPEGLVAMANEFAIEGMGCPEPPEMEKSTVGKMGLRGVSGIRYASAASSTSIPTRRAPNSGQQHRVAATTGPATHRSSSIHRPKRKRPTRG